MQIIALVGALAAASIPIAIGWRRTAGEAEMARQMGLAETKKGFSPEKFAQQTGTGLSFNQIALGFFAWTVGGFVAGLVLGPLATVLFATAGGLLYSGSLVDRRQAFRMAQAKDILRGLGVVETLIGQGKPLSDALEEAANAVGPDGQRVLSDLVHRLRTAPADQAGDAVRGWTQAWDNPAVDVVGTTLLASIEGRIEITPLVKSLRSTLSEIVEILSRARAAAKGIEWQARFLALFPPLVLVVMALTTPEAGTTYANNPLYVAPVLIGSGLSYLLSTRMIRNGLSIESSMGLHAGRYEIRMDRLGKVL
jgi:Flp pilus assembly protein TadB